VRAYLTGFMGAGKSTVGQLLAAELGCVFVDLDAAVEEAAGRSVEKVFAAFGEEHFRTLEAEQLRETAQFERCIVATGGGTPVEIANRQWMRAHGVIVWLAVPFEVLEGRVTEGASRPLWRDPSHARDLFDRRQDSYRDCDLAIEAENKAASDVALAAKAALEAAGLR